MLIHRNLFFLKIRGALIRFLSFMNLCRKNIIWDKKINTGACRWQHYILKRISITWIIGELLRLKLFIIPFQFLILLQRIIKCVWSDLSLFYVSICSRSSYQNLIIVIIICQVLRRLKSCILMQLRNRGIHLLHLLISLRIQNFNC